MLSCVRDFIGDSLKPRSFFSRLMFTNSIIIFVSLLVIGIIFGHLVQNYYYGLKEWNATRETDRIASLISEYIHEEKLEPANLENSRSKLETIARTSNMEIGIINEEGKKVVTSSTIENFNLSLEPEEIRGVLEGNKITKKIMGPADNSLLMVFPLRRNEKDEDKVEMGSPKSSDTRVVGGIIIQTPLDSFAETLNNIFRLIFYSSLIALGVALLLSIPFAKKVTSPLAEVNKSALKITKGRFSKVQPPENSAREIENFVETFNYAIDQVEATLEKQKRLEKMRKEFVADISHEFRAPLTSIKGFLELIQENDPELEEVKEYFKIMYKDTEYLEQLVSDLLVLGQLESEGTGLHKERLSPRELVERVVESSDGKARMKKLEINLQIEDDLPDLWADKNQIKRVLINLLENAINYSPENQTIEVKVYSTTIDGQKAVKFKVTDYGPGIPQEEQDKIWQRFYKVDMARTRKDDNGSGLGLAIVKNIVNRHGGEVAVDSEPGQYTTFSFTLYDFVDEENK